VTAQLGQIAAKKVERMSVLRAGVSVLVASAVALIHKFRRHGGLPHLGRDPLRRSAHLACLVAGRAFRLHAQESVQVLYSQDVLVLLNMNVGHQDVRNRNVRAPQQDFVRALLGFGQPVLPKKRLP
jgi:hypothetical protein